MNTTALHWLRRPLGVVAATALLTGCADDAPVGPDRQVTIPEPGQMSRAVDLGACDKLQAPAGSKLAFHVYAEGAQIYRWNGTSWSFVAPDATLSADAAGKSIVGTHYAGPTWETSSGGKVVAAVIDRCTPNPNAIPWLSLGVTSAAGPGVFHRVTFIQRVNTVGGNAPSAPGTFVGEEARVHYTTEYLFYRAK